MRNLFSIPFIVPEMFKNVPQVVVFNTGSGVRGFMALSLITGKK